jgi:hypothetical protein
VQIAWNPANLFGVGAAAMTIVAIPVFAEAEMTIIALPVLLLLLLLPLCALAGLVALVVNRRTRPIGLPILGVGLVLLLAFFWVTVPPGRMDAPLRQVTVDNWPPDVQSRRPPRPAEAEASPDEATVEPSAGAEEASPDMGGAPPAETKTATSGDKSTAHGSVLAAIGRALGDAVPWAWKPANSPLPLGEGQGVRAAADRTSTPARAPAPQSMAEIENQRKMAEAQRLATEQQRRMAAEAQRLAAEAQQRTRAIEEAQQRVRMMNAENQARVTSVRDTWLKLLLAGVGSLVAAAVLVVLVLLVANPRTRPVVLTILAVLAVSLLVPLLAFHLHTSSARMSRDEEAVAVGSAVQSPTHGAKPSVGPDAKPAQPVGPAWVDAAPQYSDNAYVMPVTVGPYTTGAECEAEVYPALENALAEYIKLLLGPAAAQRRVRLPDSGYQLRQQCVRQEWVETFQSPTVGPMVELHLQLVFDGKMQDRIRDALRQSIVAGRLRLAGVALAAVLALLAIVYAALKLTENASRRRRRLAAVAATVAAALVIALVAAIC